MFKYIDKNINQVLKNIEIAAKKSGRDPEDITLISVTKNADIEKMRYVAEKGFINFGENRVQELNFKYNQIQDKKIHWHFIGHLQRNKVKDVIQKVDLIHSVDSIRLMKEINKHAIKVGKKMPILIQVNVANEESKFGIKMDEIDDFINECNNYSNIIVKGLMTMAPWAENIENTRPIFMKLKERYDRIKEKGRDNIQLNYLSMGMTNDYPIAIEEGSNMVRIGTGIFGK